MRRLVDRFGTMLAVSAIALLGAGAILMATWGPSDVLLRAFAIVVLASFPGWLFVRFLVFRAGSLWIEYVLHLHRLGLDEHANLPRPPEASSYYALWEAGGGHRLASSSTIYEQKFKAYYGVAAGSEDPSYSPLTLKTLPPVLLATAVLAVGWTAVLADGSSFTGPLRLEPGERTLQALDALRFGFLGSYVFIVQMLIRRFFQSDLKPSAYFGAVARIATVLVVVFAVHHAAPVVAHLSPGAEAATAFVIGFFPLLGMQVIQAAASVAFRKLVPTLRTPYPLSDLDGLNIWYEARLLEEGIEDLQNLATGNLVDILLHTRVPVGRLVDWIDQAALLLLLDSPDGTRAGRRTHEDRAALRRLGVRTATDLETMFLPHGDDDTFQQAMAGVLDVGRPPGPCAVSALLRSFSNIPNLVHVRHWRDILCTEHHPDDPPTSAPVDRPPPALPPATASAGETAPALAG